MPIEINVPLDNKIQPIKQKQLNIPWINTMIWETNSGAT
jgi:hypothetical protein